MSQIPNEKTMSEVEKLADMLKPLCVSCSGEGRIHFNMDGSGDAKDSDEIATCPKCRGTGSAEDYYPIRGYSPKGIYEFEGTDNAGFYSHYLIAKQEDGTYALFTYDDAGIPSVSKVVDTLAGLSNYIR